MKKATNSVLRWKHLLLRAYCCNPMTQERAKNAHLERCARFVLANIGFSVQCNFRTVRIEMRLCKNSNTARINNDAFESVRQWPFYHPIQSGCGCKRQSALVFSVQYTWIERCLWSLSKRIPINFPNANIGIHNVNLIGQFRLDLFPLQVSKRAFGQSFL